MSFRMSTNALALHRLPSVALVDCNETTNRMFPEKTYPLIEQLGACHRTINQIIGLYLSILNGLKRIQKFLFV